MRDQYFPLVLFLKRSIKQVSVKVFYLLLYSIALTTVSLLLLDLLPSWQMLSFSVVKHK